MEKRRGGTHGVHLNSFCFLLLFTLKWETTLYFQVSKLIIFDFKEKMLLKNKGEGNLFYVPRMSRRIVYDYLLSSVEK